MSTRKTEVISANKRKLHLRQSRRQNKTTTSTNQLSQALSREIRKKKLRKTYLKEKRVNVAVNDGHYMKRTNVEGGKIILLQKLI